MRRLRGGDDAPAAAGARDGDGGAAAAAPRLPVVAVPALVDGVPSDGASGSVRGGGAAGSDAAPSAADVVALTPAWQLRRRAMCS